MLHLWSLPRASWIARLAAAAMILLGSMTVQQWPDPHSGLVVARGAAWFFLACSCLDLPGLLVVCLPGRLPLLWQRWPGRLHSSLPELHAEIAQELRRQRERSHFP